MGSGFRRKGLLLNTVIAEFLFRASEIKIGASPVNRLNRGTI